MHRLMTIINADFNIEFQPVVNLRYFNFCSQLPVSLIDSKIRTKYTIKSFKKAEQLQKFN